MKVFFIIILLFSSFSSYSFPIPNKNKATYDIIRKNKIIGSVESVFEIKNQDIVLTTTINIEIKVLFIPAYKFFQNTKEVWKNGEFIKITGYTDFEDNREYYISGEDKDNFFYASGMDGELIIDKEILPLNYWNKDILKEDFLFDTQKGIVRQIKVKKLDDEIIKINKVKIEAEKYILDATTNKKDKGPFPQYTIWYAKNGELLRFQFTNWKDKKEVITLRNNWIEN